ncbi:phosphoglucosamine mutase [Candidatus Micrarchaeota archaeon]|nr:phosphoglucosamine mutase [Candidatus Micrarchaeota archaeon]
MLFGTSGIRGIYGKEVTEDLALEVARLYADADLVLGRDTRKSGLSLAKMVSSGTRQKNKNVYDIGIAPTPTVALATKKRKSNGIMITASHNPPEYNGLKLFKNGRELSKNVEKEIEVRYGKEMDFAAESKGEEFADDFAIEDHKSLIKSLVDERLIEKKRPKIVVDCNGAGSVITPYLLRELGCRVISLNSEADGFNRPSEPNEKNLQDLMKIVSAVGADLGIAHDGDADRAVVVDETGAMLPLDTQLAIMIENEMDGNVGKVISTVEASLMIREVVESKNGKIEITPVGSAHVSEKLEKDGACFGGEPCGEYVFEKGVHTPDGILTAAKFVEIFCKNGNLSRLREKYKSHFMLREKFRCEGKDKYGLVDGIKGQIKTSGKIRNDDGIRVDEEDGWFLIRASGTEPLIRLTMEYKEKKKLEKMAEYLKNLIIKSI